MTEFFVVCSTGQLVIPREMFHLIMSFIPAFPFYFILRSVCSQWLIEFQDQIYGAVEYLSLVDDGRPKYYFRSDNNGEETLVRLKSIVSSDFDDDKTHLFEFLANMFPNVKHLRLSFGSLRPIHFNQCVNAMLPKLTQLETLDILGTVNPSSCTAEIVTGHYLLDSIARSLPSSIKSLNFIGVLLSGTPDTLARLKMFSNKGRQLIRKSTPLPDFSTTQNDFTHVDIQSLSLTCIFWNQDFFGTNDWKSLQEMYSNFEASVVDPSYHGDNYPPTIPVDSYLTYMSKKEGVILSRMMNLSRETYEITEAVVDIVVHEYPFFQPLLSLGAQECTNAMILRAPQTKFDVHAFCNIGNELLLRTLELLTDPSRMKYPELVFNIDSTVSVGKVQPSSTLLGHLITRCSDDQMLNLTKTVIETYYPSMTVNGVQNYLVTVFNLPHCGARTDLMRYLLILKPELISLGDLDGIINGDQKDLQIIQLFLNRQHNSAERECLEDIKYLVTAGASVTQVDREGNNILHSACRATSIDLVKFLVSVCSESLMFERNKQGRTPIELIYLSRPPICLRASFLDEVAKFPCFKNQALTDYKTSCGTLLHAAVKYEDQATAHWLIHNGFDANILNDKGENALFSLSERTPEKRPRIYNNQADFIDGYAVELIKAGAQFDVESTEGETVVTFALRNKNYQLINTIIQTPSISSEPLSKLLAPRMKYGLNALHYVVQKMAEMVSYRGEREEARASRRGIYPVIRHCAQLCLEHYPEMLHELSEDSREGTKDICGVSPLQILLRARRGLFLMEELSIKLSDIANEPVFASKDPNVIAPIPVLYLALNMTLDIPLFDRLMTYTDNVLIRDETQATKPNLLHIAVERDASLCQCVINHWKERYPDQKELNQLINQPLENNGAGGQKPTNAALIACRLNRYAVFSMLWPFMKPVAAQFDCPVKIALESNHHQFVVSAVKDHAIFPTKAQLHRSIRKGLSQSCVNSGLESNILYLMVLTEEKQPNPSWLELFAQSPSDPVAYEECDESQLSTLQLIVYERAESIFSWLVQHYSDDPLLDRAVRAVDPLTGNTLLHLLTNRSRQRSTSTILFSLVSRFELDDAPIRTKQFEPTALPSLDHLNMKELTEFINIQDKSGRTCLHYSGRNRIHSLLSYLLILGASTEIQDSAGRSPLVLMDSELKQIVQKFLAERARKGEEEDNARGWQKRWQP